MGADRSLPSLVLIADGFTRPGIDQRIVQAVRYGVSWVILRDQGARPDIIELSAGLLVQRMRKVMPEVIIGLNGPEPIARRLEVGWHRTSHVPFAGEASGGTNQGRRGQRMLEGRSTHNPEEVRRAVDEGMDYVLFGHVHATASHRGEPPRGLSALREAVEAAGTMPVIALGGITPALVNGCLEAGARGVAVLSGLMQAPNLFQAVDAYTKPLIQPPPSE